MRKVSMWLAGLAALAFAAPLPAQEVATNPPSPQRVTILPIREDIMPPLVYLVRRGVKEAMEAKSDLLILDMETKGGRVDSTEQIIEILAQFKGRTITYVNKEAYSAGAFISVATQQIFMAPESVIGAAAPILMSPGGTGVEQMPDTMEVKATSAISAKIRAYAEKNGHNPAVVQAMIDKKSELVIDGVTINEKGNVLTLNNREAERKYGDPPKPLLSAGTVESIEALLERVGFAGAEVRRIVPTGAERMATWINALNWLWLIIGVAGIYIEFKTPGFGLPGIVGICSFALYFLGSYVAGVVGDGVAGVVHPRIAPGDRGIVHLPRHRGAGFGGRDVDAVHDRDGDGGHVPRDACAAVRAAVEGAVTRSGLRGDWHGDRPGHPRAAAAQNADLRHARDAVGQWR
ncbi:MAG: ATP-dependent Clp protease proteolytic subunit [Verrucomicrobia bacterium]|nr:ATP-dependent Clp protease proteolytic subunit [Verrucomicrobiota bacterium]